jgi:hypothetical protein
MISVVWEYDAVEMGISIPMSSEELATSILGVGSRLP